MTLPPEIVGRPKPGLQVHVREWLRRGDAMAQSADRSLMDWSRLTHPTFVPA
jgi:hypothetical protein